MPPADVRYDGKVRHEGDTIHVLSPQVGLRYLPNESWDVVLSFSESYADAPYWYRYNAIPSYRGGRNLKPEYLKTLQLTPAVTLSTRVKARVNLFYEPGRIVDRAFVVNTGVRVGSLWARRCFLDARVYNLFDQAYEQGGSVSHPYPQQGRSGMLTVGFAF